MRNLYSQTTNLAAVFSIAAIFGADAAFGQTIDSLSCNFEGGTVVALTENGDHDRSATAIHKDVRRYLFYNLASGVSGKYKNLGTGGVGQVLVSQGRKKIDVIEQVPGADNGFFVTVFKGKSGSKGYPAVKSDHSFIPDIPFYHPRQWLGWCR